MPTTDVAEIRDVAKQRAETARDIVLAQAASAGESLNTAVVSALDTAGKKGKKARQRAEKSAKKAGKNARKHIEKRAHDLNVTVQEKAGRKPKRRRKGVVLGGVALAGVAIAAVVSRKKSTPPPMSTQPPSELPSDRPSDQ
jgi:hypothetical protein